jgi:NTP pyrophosphatase (non-canonical NTP hydrolase)
MEEQLRANDHKPGWKKDDARDLIGRLREETSELYSAVNGWLVCPTDEMEHEADHVLKEAADVANFAMMVADVCGALAPAGGAEAARLRIPETKENATPASSPSAPQAAETRWAAYDLAKGREFNKTDAVILEGYLGSAERYAQKSMNCCRALRKKLQGYGVLPSTSQEAPDAG